MIELYDCFIIIAMFNYFIVFFYRESEIWRAGKTVRSLRPENK
jgi:hypothetical protein